MQHVEVLAAVVEATPFPLFASPTDINHPPSQS